MQPTLEPPRTEAGNSFPLLPPGEFLSQKNWKVEWTAAVFYGKEADELEGAIPDEVHVVTDNMLLSGGINLMLSLLIGSGGTVYSNANAYLYVGDSTTAAASGQTDLQGTTAEAAMDATYPLLSITTLTFRATFGTGVANFQWNEFGVKNATGAPGSAGKVLLNRKVTTILTKTSNASVQFTVTITIT